MLTQQEKRELLGMARDAIARAVEKGRGAGGGQDFHAPAGSALAVPSGVFVTIRVDDELRGCIGYIESSKPLAEVVAEVAVKAALEDPRFPPMDASELALATLEVSILSPLRKIGSVEEIKIGTHGLLLETGRKRGLLLPQVATENGWERETFLDNTARKAGLPAKAWRDPAVSIYVFSAEIVNEKELPA